METPSPLPVELISRTAAKPELREIMRSVNANYKPKDYGDEPRYEYPDKPHIRIVVPVANHGSISPQTLEFLEAVKKETDFTVEVMFSRGTVIAENRNRGVNDGKDSRLYQPDSVIAPFTHYLALDADIGAKPEHLKRLLEYDKDIIGCPYVARANDKNFIIGYFHYQSERCYTECRADTKGLIKVHWIGAGFLLIKRAVFSKVEFPWWQYYVAKWKDQWHEYGVIDGEDIGFCRGAMKVGIDVYADCDNPVEHILDFKG